MKNLALVVWLTCIFLIHCHSCQVATVVLCICPHSWNNLKFACISLFFFVSVVRWNFTASVLLFCDQCEMSGYMP